MSGCLVRPMLEVGRPREHGSGPGSEGRGSVVDFRTAARSCPLSPSDEAVIEVWRSLRSVAEPLRLEVLAERELTVSQVRLLYSVRARGTSRIGEIATTLGLSAPSATSLVDRLVRRGLLARQDDLNDRRWVLVSLTQRGLDVLSELGRPSERYLSLVLSRMRPGERSRFDSAMRVFLTASAAVQPLKGDMTDGRGAR